MNVSTEVRVDILQWLDRFTLTVASMSCRRFKALVDAHEKVLPLFWVARLHILREANDAKWKIGLVINSDYNAPSTFISIFGHATDVTGNFK